MPVITGTVYDAAGSPAAGRKVRLYRRDTGALLAQTNTGTGVVVPGDPDYSSVSLLLLFDGPDGSTTFTDKSPTPKTVTGYGNAKISTAQSKFGGASLSLGGSGDYLHAQPDSALAFGTGDFTAEVFLRSTTTSEKIIFDAGVSGAASWQLLVKSGKLTWYEFSPSGYTVTGAKSINDGSWHHVAACRSSGVLRFFVDGELDGSGPNTMNYASSVAGLGIGGKGYSPNPTYDFPGYIDALRITKGIARYTANFTPPAAPFYEVAEMPAEPIGQYTLTTSYTGEVQRLVLDDDAGTLYNDLIDRVMVS